MEDRRKPQESQQQLKELDNQHGPPSCTKSAIILRIRVHAVDHNEKP